MSETTALFPEPVCNAIQEFVPAIELLDYGFPVSSPFGDEPSGACASVPASDFGANFADYSVHTAKIGVNFVDYGPNLGPKKFGTWVPQFGLNSGTQVPNFPGSLLEPCGPPLEPTGGQSSENCAEFDQNGAKLETKRDPVKLCDHIAKLDPNNCNKSFEIGTKLAQIGADYVE